MQSRHQTEASHCPPNSQSDLRAQLVLACQHYDQQRPGLSEQIADYLLTGEPATSVALLEQARGPSSLYRPGMVKSQDESVSEVGEAMTAAFLNPMVRTASFLRRLGIVCEACQPGIRLYHVTSNIPGWYGALLTFCEHVCDRWFMDSPLAAKWLPSRKQLLSLARDYDQPVWYVDAYILEGGNGSFRNTFRQHLLKDIQWVELAQEEHYGEVLTALHFSGRQAFCQWLAKSSSLPATTLPLLMTLAADKSGAVRKQALVALRQTKPTERLAYLQCHFDDAKATVRGHWVTVAADTDGSGALMQNWLNTEQTASVIKALERHLQYQQLSADSERPSWHLPDVAEVVLDTDLPDSWLPLCLVARRQLIEEQQQEIERIHRAPPDSYMKQRLKGECHELERLEAVTEQEIAQVLQKMASGVSGKNGTIKSIVRQANLMAQPEATLGLFIRFEIEADARTHRSGWHWILRNQHFCRLAESQITDIRQFLSLDHEPVDTLTIAKFAQQIFAGDWQSAGELPPAVAPLPVWPLLAEHPELVERGLCGEPPVVDSRYDSVEVMAQTLYLLAEFESVPTHWLVKIYEHGLGSYKKPRQFAQATAEKLGVDLTYILPGLKATSKETRIVAANWLSKLALPAAQDALREAIKQEKDVPTRAQLLDALESCGGDIAEFLSPQVLKREALAGLKKAVPKSMNWLMKTQLPVCHFTDGSDVDAEVIYWWAVLAVKLKQPQGNRLLERYLSQLNPASRQALAKHILSVFITQDTLGPTDQDAHDYAEAHQQSCYQDYQRWAKYDDAYAQKTQEDAYRECFRRRKAELYGSAIKDKGVLALISGGDAVELLSLIQSFMKDFYARRAQIEAMLLAISHDDDPAIIQFMLSLARRYRTKSVQELARTLVQQTAERNGWTQDQLADRTIQTAGFERLQGPTSFEYGTRTLAIQLTDDLKFQLLNEDGKVLKSLPQPRKDDEGDATSETKKWFSHCKKELKQVVTQQRDRLYEAMLTERHWRTADWLEYLHQHPVMFRLLQRTLWQVQTGETWLTFRPAEDGSFIDADDDDVTMAGEATIRLVSGNQLNEVARKQWQAHLKDYQVKPLFDQLRQQSYALEPGQQTLAHHRGRMTDTFSFRGMLTKKGYQRGAVEDAGFFDHYFKMFDSLHLRVEFGFSGNCVPEENEAAAMYDIKVLKYEPTSRHWNPYTVLPLAEVPANLLNAIAQDYEDVAKQCAQDPDWEKKLPW